MATGASDGAGGWRCCPPFPLKIFWPCMKAMDEATKSTYHQVMTTYNYFSITTYAQTFGVGSFCFSFSFYSLLCAFFKMLPPPPPPPFTNNIRCMPILAARMCTTGIEFLLFGVFCNQSGWQIWRNFVEKKTMLRPDDVSFGSLWLLLGAMAEPADSFKSWCSTSQRSAACYFMMGRLVSLQQQ